jgi:hypothetical protein
MLPTRQLYNIDTTNIIILKNYTEAAKDEQWIHAMMEEIEAHLRNKVYTSSPVPDNQQLVKCKWVLLD